LGLNNKQTHPLHNVGGLPKQTAHKPREILARGHYTVNLWLTNERTKRKERGKKIQQMLSTYPACSFHWKFLKRIWGF